MNLLYITQESLFELAQKLVAAVNNAVIVTKIKPSQVSIFLQLDEHGLALVCDELGVVYVEELYTTLYARMRTIKNEVLVQLTKSHENLVVYDLTAGLGRDGFILAKSGHNVTLVERNPILALILNYVVKRQVIPGLAPKIQIIHMDSCHYLTRQMEMFPDIIYLDPMFMDNAKAKPKKYMQLINKLWHKEDQISEVKATEQELFKIAYMYAQQKIIVKRDNKQQRITTQLLPTYSKQYKTIRYDVYVKA